MTGWGKGETSRWNEQGLGGIHYHRSRETVNHARGIVNIGTLNIETGPRRFTRETLEKRDIKLSLGSILSRRETRTLRFPAAFLSPLCVTPISLVLNRSRGIGISPMSLATAVVNIVSIIRPVADLSLRFSRRKFVSFQVVFSLWIARHRYIKT